MKFILPLALVLLLTASASAVEIEISQQVRLRSSEPADQYAWHITGPAGKVAHLIDEGGRAAIFAGSDKGKYTVFLAALQSGKLTTTVTTVDLGGPAPGPDPDPDPDPKPDPDPGPKPTVPAGKYGMTKATYDLAVSKAPDKSLCPKLGDNFVAVSAQLAAGGYLNIGLANQDLTARNREVIGDARDAWLPFFNGWAAMMTEKTNDGTIPKTDQALADAYRATGDGLKLVK